MTAAAPSMDPAPAPTKSSLEIMLDTIRERDEQRQNNGEPFLPPSPARPRGRGRPPTSTRWPLPVGFKVGNGGGAVASTVPVEKKPDVVSNGAIISADVIHHAIETVVDDAMSPDSEEQCIGAQGSGMVADSTLSPYGTDKLIQEDQDGTAIWIHHGAIDIVDSCKQQDSKYEIDAEDERSPHDAMVVVPTGDDATGVCVVSSSASPSSAARVGRRTPRQNGRSVSPPRSSSGSSRESEPEKRTKAGVGKLLWGSTSCARAPVAAVARMVLNSCGSNSSGVRAPEEQTTDQGAETSLHDASVESPSGGETDVSTVKTSAASSMSRSGVVLRWLKNIFGRLRDARDVEETTKARFRQRKSRSTPQTQIVLRSC